ncbi:MAG: hypothetical protein HFH47_02475 [Bacilli bacterium]|nr:hypothetical protein [Bacilli bacterium]
MKKEKLYDKWMKAFQTKVFQSENIKFKIADKIFPNYYKHAEKNIKKSLKQELENAKTEEEKELLIEMARSNVLELRKEKHRRENMNYHLDVNNPNKTLFWLNKNKEIHKRSLKKKLIIIPILIALLIGGNLLGFGSLPTIINTLLILMVSLEAVSTIIDTNCILLQNYNIKRVNRYIEGPYKRHKQKLEKKAIEYNEMTNVVSGVVKESEKIPTIDEVLNNIETSKQAKQLLELV